MIERLFTRRLVGPEDLAPSDERLEVAGVFNPGVVRLEETGETILLLRVAERARPTRPRHVALPRYEGKRLVIDHLPEEQVERIDQRVVRWKRDGNIRLTSVSHLRVARSRDGLAIDSIGPEVLGPEEWYESYGLEDPRLTRIEGRFQVAYTAVSPHGAGAALASTTDFERFTRQGLVLAPENKDFALFPERFEGSYAALHRPNPATAFRAPGIWLARSLDLLHWGDLRPIPVPKEAWNTGRVGAGCPPLRTERGWLEIYHGNAAAAPGAGVGRYAGAALLLDPRNPAHLLACSREPILAPSQPFELEGFVPGVIFPTGLVEREDELWIYFGAADTCTAVTAFPRSELLRRLEAV